MSLELRVNSATPVARVTAIGEIDVQSAPMLRQGVDRALAGGASTVAMDLAAVTFIDSSGLGAVVGQHKALLARGARLVLVAPTPQTRRLLAITHLDEVLDVRDDVDGMPESAPAATARGLHRPAWARARR